MAADSRTTTADERSPLTRSALLLRSRRRALRPITEGSPDRRIRLREAIFRRGLVLADIAAASLALYVCLYVLGSDSLRPIALLALPLVVIAGKAHGLYDRDELVLNKTTMDQAPQLFQCATLYTLLVVLLQDEFVDGSLSTVQVVGLWGTLFFAALFARRLARLLARAMTPVERCLFVGSQESFMRLESKLPRDDRRATLVGRMALNNIASEQMADAGTLTLHHLIEDLGVERVIIEPSEELPQITLDFVREAKATGVRVSLLPRILEVVGSTIEVDDVNGLTLLGLRRFGLSRSSRLIKRGFDALGSGLALALLSPVLAVIAILIKLDSRGRVFFRQTRVGRNGQLFMMWKFRTMFVDAEERKADLHVHTDPTMGLFKLPDDPRITRAGRFLRGASLDELPQLINVLRGEMSLVGPRPLIADEDKKITGLDRSRLQLTPGITGHWQIQGERVPMAEMVKLDYLYVATWSLWSDVKLLLRTIPYVIARRGM
jgi:exopolysaccharide biosynthesis polyprenyl glycosylphosphotransferase